MTTYFYCYSVPLEDGSIIKPGNWGRILKKYTPQNTPNSWSLVRELIYENVRKELFPNKPSRFSSIFLCPTEDEIRKFRIAHNRHLDIVYEVEIVDDNQPLHIGDYSIANMQHEDNFDIIEFKARKYWTGENVAHPEIITASRIKIIKEVIGTS